VQQNKFNLNFYTANKNFSSNIIFSKLQQIHYIQTLQWCGIE